MKPFVAIALCVRDALYAIVSIVREEGWAVKATLDLL